MKTSFRLYTYCLFCFAATCAPFYATAQMHADNPAWTTQHPSLGSNAMSKNASGIALNLVALNGPGLPAGDCWEWQNPTPQGDPLNDLFFVGNQTGWTAGANGTILKTVDGGASWSPQATGTNAELTSIHFADMQTGWAVGDSGIILSTVNGGVSWSAQSSPTNNRLNAVHFFGPQKGWAVGMNGTIVNTTDAGLSWSIQSSNTTKHLNAVFFVDDQNGWAVGDSGTIVITSNGGQLWTPQTTSGTTWRAVSMSNPQTGWVAGGDYSATGFILKTINGGQNWVLQESPPFDTPYALNFIDAQTGWAACLNGKIYHTTDGGLSWLPQSPATSLGFTSAHFTDLQHGWALAFPSQIWRTIDGGGNWELLTSGIISYSFESIQFTDSQNGWAADYQTLYNTTNGGQSWAPLSNWPSQPIWNFYFANAQTGWAVGNGGRIYKTTTGGLNWAQQNCPTNSHLAAVHFSDALNGCVVGWGGTILTTTNGGLNWDLRTSGTSTLLTNVFLADSQVGWVVGWGGTILKTTNGGLTWTSEDAGPLDLLTAIDFADQQTGWVVGDYGAILRTNNGGQTWTMQTPGTDAFPLFGVQAIDTQTCWVTGDKGALLKTIDGGQTWVHQNSGTVNGLHSVWFTNDQTGWVAGDNGTILRYPISAPPCAGGLISPIPNSNGVSTNAALSWSANSPCVDGYRLILGTSPGGIDLYNQVDVGNVTAWQPPLPLPAGVTIYASIVPYNSAGSAIGCSSFSFTTALSDTCMWSEQISGTNYPLWACQFINDSTGWAVGSSQTILKTTNGGASWANQNPNGSSEWLNTVFFTDANTGYVAGFSGTVLKTIDGGSSWVSQDAGTPFEFKDACFVDPDTGWLVGSGTDIRKTVDGGQNWTLKTSDLGAAQFFAVQFINSSLGWVLDRTGNILKTTDGGDTWIDTTVGQSPPPLWDMYFTDPLHGWIVGGGGVVYKSLDGGLSWQLCNTPTTNWLYSVHFLDNQTGWISSAGGEIYKTEDGGATWTDQNSGFNSFLEGIQFTDDTHGWAVGNLGTILHFSCSVSNPCTTVTTTADSGPGSFREAVICANANPGPDTIRFDIPGAGPHIIQPASAIPAFQSELVIDASTQPGWYLGKIVLDGSLYPTSTSVFRILNKTGFELYGIVAKNFPDVLMDLVRSQNIILGAPGKGNAFYDNSVLFPNGNGEMVISECSNVVIQSNRIGVTENNQPGTLHGNTQLGLEGNNVQIGGSRSAGEGNVFAQNAIGIFLWNNLSNNFDPGNIRIQGNDLGTNSTATADWGNARNIWVQDSIPGVLIGGGSDDLANVIGYADEGVYIDGCCMGNQVLITQNRFACNNKGIDWPLAAFGAPSITNATVQAISGLAPPGAQVEVFAEKDDGCPDVACQGFYFLGAVQSDAQGNWLLNAPFASNLEVGDQITATKTIGGRTSKFSICTTVLNMTGCNAVSDSMLLVDFYNSHGGPNWSNQQGWLDGVTPMWMWHGISANYQGCVRSITLSDTALVGPLPNFSLPALEVLAITDSHLNGQVPDFDQLPVLRTLDLNNNDLDGNLPNFNQLHNLELIDLDSNLLTGPVPDFQHVPLLWYLDLNNNFLTGTLPTFDSLSNLTHLDLQVNQLTGSIPAWPTQMPLLNFLGLAENGFTDTIPDFSNFHNLKRLYLNFNRLESPVPHLSQLDSLNVLGLDNNRMTFDGLVYHNNQNYGGYSYAPQDSIYIDTTFTLNTGDDLTISLAIDDTLTTNNYQWFKDGNPWLPPAPNVPNSNQLVFNNLGTVDAGQYWVHVRNLGAMNLILKSRKITLIVNPNSNCLRVTNTNDSGFGSLREAITCSNLNPGPDTIRFAILAPGPHVISPNSGFDVITDDGTVIDATTQPGWAPGNIVLDGSLLGNPAAGLDVAYNSGFELYGLTIRFVPLSAGLNVYQCSNVRIGAPGKGNLIYGNHRQLPVNQHEITLQEVTNGVVQGNIVGADQNYLIPNGVPATGADIGLEGINILIGGEKSQGEGNVFSNGFFGVFCYDAPANGFTPGNYQVFGNAFGIAPGGANISGGGTVGVGFLSGIGPVKIGDGTVEHENQFFNLHFGVHQIGAGNQLSIRRNQMACNDTLGIYRVDWQAPMVSVAGSAQISGTAFPGTIIEVYRSGDAACPNAVCQGRDYLGTTTTTAGGTWVLNSPYVNSVQPGDKITATATYASNNTSPFSACVTLCDPLFASIGGDSTLCAGESTTLTASGGAVFQWSNGGPATASWSFMPGNTSVYTVTVTAASGCTSVLSRQVVVQPLPVASAFTLTPSICEGDTIVLIASGGPGYSWSGPGNFSSTQANPQRPNATLAMSGTYTVVVTDGNSCSATASAQVDVGAKPILSENSIAAHCGQADGSIDLGVGGTGSFLYSWTTGATSQDLSNVAAGVYGVTVTGTNNCSATTQAEVNSVGRPMATAAAMPVSACGVQNGEVNLSVMSGTPPFQYQWSNGVTTEDLGSLPGGTYTVTVTDAALCKDTLAAVVQAPTAPTFGISTVAVSSCTTPNGSVNLSVQTGIPPFQFLWSNGATTEDLANEPPGMYSVTISDAAQCTATANTTILNNATGSISVNISEEICPGDSVGFAGVFYQTPGVYQQTSVSVLGCDSVVTLQLDWYPVNNYVASPDSFDLDQSVGARLLEIALNDQLADGDYTLSIIQSPQAGSASTYQNRAIKYVLEDQDYEGYDFLWYTLCSNVCPAYCDTAKVRILVQAPADEVLKQHLTNVLTPYLQDGHNDLFDPVAILTEQGYTVNEANSSLDIYNRWGDLIVRKEGSGLSWDGFAVNGKEAPAGTYYYVFRADTGGEKKIVVAGAVMVWK